MEFKKLALAAAVAALPATGFSMEAMEDSALSGVTGQDGISIGLATDVVAGLKVHDKDGAVGVTGANGGGAIVIDGFGITRANATDQITLSIDADDGAGGAAPFLNIEVGLPTGLEIALGSVGVAATGRDDTTPTWTTSNTVTGVVNLGTLTLGATTLNIQLGNEPQGNMIALDTTITGGINLTGFSVTDAGGSITGGSLTTDLQIVNTGGGTDLDVVTGINIGDGTSATGANGLVIGLDGIGGTGAGIDVRMADLTLGGTSAAALGDVELINMQLSGNLVISGH